MAASMWIQAARPRTLSASLGAVMVGAALAQAANRFRWDATLAALAVAVWLQIGCNLYNDYGDFVRGADRERIGPARAVQSGWITPRQAQRAAVLALAIAALAGLYLCVPIGWPAVAIGGVAIVSAVAYTAGPAPLAYLGLGDAFVLLFFGVVAVTGTYFAQAAEISTRAVVLSLAVGAMATAILVVNNLRDQDGDRRASKRTLVVRFGERFGRIEYGALLIVAYAIVAVLGVSERRPQWLAPLATAPLAATQIRRVANRDGVDLHVELGRTALLGLLFDALLALGALS